MIKHLVVPDTHIMAGQNTDRCDLISEHILSYQPDKVIFLGDWWDFDCISHFNKKGSMQLEGARLKDEVDAGIAAFHRALSAIRYGEERARRNKKTIPVLPVIFTEGNHEYRLTRYVEENPVLEGAFDLYSSLQERYAFQYCQYGSNIDVDGILYTHIPFKNGVPIQSVVNTTGQALTEISKSCFFGHTHRLELKQFERSGHPGLITAMNCGGFMDELPHYIKSRDNTKWWAGLIEVEIEPHRQTEPEWLTIKSIPIHTLYRMYS